MSILSDELTNDPLGRGYAAMSNAEAAADLNAVNLPGPGDPLALFNFFINNRYRTNSGTDTALMQIYGRLIMASEADIGANVFGESPSVPLTTDQKASSCTMLAILIAQTTGADIDFSDTGNAFNGMLGDLVNEKVISNGQRNSIRAISENKQSRAQELGVGFVSAGRVGKER